MIRLLNLLSVLNRTLGIILIIINFIVIIFTQSWIIEKITSSYNWENNFHNLHHHPQDNWRSDHLVQSCTHYHFCLENCRDCNQKILKNLTPTLPYYRCRRYYWENVFRRCLEKCPGHNDNYTLCRNFPSIPCYLRCHLRCSWEVISNNHRLKSGPNNHQNHSLGKNLHRVRHYCRCHCPCC